jgi:hypothetical protein
MGRRVAHSSTIWPPVSRSWKTNSVKCRHCSRAQLQCRQSKWLNFHCVSPACFPVIEMAGFRSAPSSDPVVEIREAKEEEQEPSPNRVKLRSSPQLLSMSSINYFSPARRSQSFAVRPVWRSPAIRLGGLYRFPFLAQQPRLKNSQLRTGPNAKDQTCDPLT